MNEAFPHRPDIELTLHTEQEFLASLVHDIAATQSGDRVALTTMSFEPGELQVQKVVEAMHHAANRDVEVKFGVDAFTFLVDSTSAAIGPSLLPLPFGQSAFQRRRRALEELDEHRSVDVRVLNEPKHLLSNPFANRSHIKAAVINDKAYIIGPNLHLTSRVDSAVSFTDAQTADKLYSLLDELVTIGNTREVLGGEDRTWQLDRNTQLIIDAGKPGQSTILERSFEIIDGARESVTFASQYFPRGQVARHLAQAIGRDIEVRALYNDPGVQGGLGAYPEKLAIARAKRRLPPELFAYQLPVTHQTHTKGVTSEHTALPGNHNLDERGVKFGTAEISLLRHDPAFAREFGSFLLQQHGLVDTRQLLAYQVAEAVA